MGRHHGAVGARLGLDPAAGLPQHLPRLGDPPFGRAGMASRPESVDAEEQDEGGHGRAADRRCRVRDEPRRDGRAGHRQEGHAEEDEPLRGRGDQAEEEHLQRGGRDQEETAALGRGPAAAGPGGRVEPGEGSEDHHGPRRGSREPGGQPPQVGQRPLPGFRPRHRAERGADDLPGMAAQGDRQRREQEHEEPRQAGEEEAAAAVPQERARPDDGGGEARGGEGGQGAVPEQQGPGRQRQDADPPGGPAPGPLELPDQQGREEDQAGGRRQIRQRRRRLAVEGGRGREQGGRQQARPPTADHPPEEPGRGQSREGPEEPQDPDRRLVARPGQQQRHQGG